MRRITSPFWIPIFEYSESGTIEKSLNPFATPFLKDGTMRACVASYERSLSAPFTVDLASTYWFSESCRTSFCAAGCPGCGIGEKPRFGGAAALLRSEEHTSE